MNKKIFWIDNQSIYDARTHSLVKPSQFNIAIILDLLRQAELPQDVLPKKIHTLALLMMINQKQDIFKLLQTMAYNNNVPLQSIDQFKIIQEFNDFQSNECSQWWLTQVQIQDIEQIIQQYLSENTTYEKDYNQLFEECLSQCEPFRKNKTKGISNKNATNKKSKQKQQQQQEEEKIPNIKVANIDLQQDEIQKILNNESKPNLEDIIQIASKQQAKDRELKETETENQKKNEKQSNIEIISHTSKAQSNHRQVSPIKYVGQPQIANKTMVLESNTIEIPTQKQFETNKKKDTLEQLLCASTEQSGFKVSQKPLTRITNTLKEQAELIPPAKKQDEFPKIDQLDNVEQYRIPLTEKTQLFNVYEIIKGLCCKYVWWKEYNQKCESARTEEDLKEILWKVAPILIDRWCKLCQQNQEQQQQQQQKLQSLQKNDQTLKEFADNEQKIRQTADEREHPSQQQISSTPQFNSDIDHIPLSQNNYYDELQNSPHKRYRTPSLTMKELDYNNIFLQQDLLRNDFIVENVDCSFDDDIQISDQSSFQKDKDKDDEDDVIIDEDLTKQNNTQRLESYYKNPAFNEIKTYNAELQLDYMSRPDKMAQKLLMITKDTSLDLDLELVLTNKIKSTEQFEECTIIVYNILKNLTQSCYKPNIQLFQAGEQFRASLEIKGMDDKTIEQKQYISSSLLECNVQIRIMAIKFIIDSYFKKTAASQSMFQCIALILSKILPNNMKYLVNDLNDQIQLSKSEKEKQSIIQDVKNSMKSQPNSQIHIPSPNQSPSKDTISDIKKQRKKKNSKELENQSKELLSKLKAKDNLQKYITEKQQTTTKQTEKQKKNEKDLQRAIQRRQAENLLFEDAKRSIQEKEIQATKELEKRNQETQLLIMKQAEIEQQRQLQKQQEQKENLKPQIQLQPISDSFSSSSQEESGEITIVRILIIQKTTRDIRLIKLITLLEQILQQTLIKQIS